MQEIGEYSFEIKYMILLVHLDFFFNAIFYHIAHKYYIIAQYGKKRKNYTQSDQHIKVNA